MPRRYRQSPAILRHGRHQHLTSTNTRNIYRFKTGVYVNKQFMRHQYRAYFSFGKYGGSFEKVIAAAIIERDWLDRYRRRILDRLQVKMVKAMIGPGGRKRRRVRVIDIRRVIREVRRELERGER